MIWLTVLRRYWFLILLFAIGAYVVILQHERDTARAQVVQLKDNLAAIRAANDLAIKKAIYAKDQSDAAYQSSTAAAVLFGRALSDRVRAYENRICPNPVPAAGQPVEATRKPEISEAIASALDACARDANRLQNAVDWAADLKYATEATRP